MLRKCNLNEDEIMNNAQQDGIHAMVPREKMTPGARKLRDIYDLKPGAPIFHREFYIWEEAIERWHGEGMPKDVDHGKHFSWDPPGSQGLFGAGWCEASFVPGFETKVIEDRGDTEVVQDSAGRHVLYFKGRRHGFMPEYIDHPVKDMKTWVENVKWRMNPATPERAAECDRVIGDVKKAAGDGLRIVQHVAGAYMYLRSLVGPETLLYAFYDMPEVVHDCMKTWFELADSVSARHQQHVTLDEIFFGEDICYNHGSLISPEMMKEFLLPYYQQLISNVKSRQIDKSRHLFVQIDTDGYADPVIPVYRDGIGMDVMSPFEVASNCDVVETRKQYPDLVISGGIDKRVLAQGEKEIDRMLERIIPFMRAKGGYTPTCDHGVPTEVSYDNYMHYRRRCVELGG